MRILGIDPGLANLGWGIVEVATRGDLSLPEMRRIDSGVFEPAVPAALLSATETAQTRAKCDQISRHVEALLDSFMPDWCACEAWLPYAGKNEQGQRDYGVGTTLRAPHTGRVIGVIQAECRHRGVRMTEYMSQSTKHALTKNRSATKAQVAQMVKAFLRLPAPPPSHEADALGVALLHWSKRTEWLS